MTTEVTVKIPLSSIKLNRKLKSQTALVLDYLTFGRTLTPLIAMTTLGVASLTSRIAELREAGVKIDREFKPDHLGRRYASYKLSPDQGHGGE